MPWPAESAKENSLTGSTGICILGSTTSTDEIYFNIYCRAMIKKYFSMSATGYLQNKKGEYNNKI